MPAQGCIGSIGLQETTLDEEEIGTFRQGYHLGDVLFGKGAIDDIGDLAPGGHTHDLLFEFAKGQGLGAAGWA